MKPSIRIVLYSTCLIAAAQAQPAAAPARSAPANQQPAITSPEVSSDRQITFRLFAPHAQMVKLSAGDIPSTAPRSEMKKSEEGVWEMTVGPVNPGAYRYTFNIDGVSVMDPHNPAVSESNNNAWSLVYVPGSDFMDTKEVPHGAVASVTYYSTALKKFRRMHVYTPPGYETGSARYPIFYLLHGAGDSDDSWTSVGRAGFIIDNLIAAGKAKPMVVVMPAGHTAQFTMRPPGGARRPDFNDDFVRDFLTDIMPYAETHYRVIADRDHRAIAGLSMGGSQTLNIAIPHADKFAYIGVFSSGIFGIAGPITPQMPAPSGPTWEEQHTAVLDNPAVNKGIKLFWFGVGKDDFLVKTTKGTIAMFEKHGYKPVFVESEGGHTWINWRDYLDQFAPQLF